VYQKAALKLVDTGQVLSIDTTSLSYSAPELHTCYPVVKEALDADFKSADEMLQRKAYWRARRSQAKQRKVFE